MISAQLLGLSVGPALASFAVVNNEVWEDVLSQRFSVRGCCGADLRDDNRRGDTRPTGCRDARP